MTTPPKQPVTGWQRSLVIGLDKLIYRLSRNWVTAVNLLLAIYVGLPILAPVLMNVGLTLPARAIYTVYRPMCHQMATRSFFLFGEQVAYPRALAGTDLQPLEAYAPQLPEFSGVTDENWVDFFFAAQRFVGNEQLGYKMALCERDMAIYGFLLLGGILYGFLRKRRQIKPLPLWLFILIGMGPIALDGFSQLFGYYATPLDGSAASGIQAAIGSVFPLRESTPFLRTFTGAIFGFMLAWLTFPHIDGGMRGTEQEVGRKLRRIGEIE